MPPSDSLSNVGRLNNMNRLSRIKDRWGNEFPVFP